MEKIIHLFGKLLFENEHLIKISKNPKKIVKILDFIDRTRAPRVTLI
jgi:hypothetical protein